jgi:double-stranded uracil-DNA glycosylase
MTSALPDILAKHLSVVFCGINPGQTAATAGHHFSNGTNRFWRVLHLSGFTPEQIRPEDDRSILNYGYGLTTAGGASDPKCRRAFARGTCCGCDFART